MTVLNRNPQNTNLLQPTKFLLTFDRLGSVQYFCQTVNIPSVSLNSLTRVTPTLDTNYPDTKLNFSSFDITFLLDEDLVGWQNLYNWFLALAHPDMNQRSSLLAQQGGKRVSDANLTILTNLNNSSYRLQLINAFPTDLSSIDFDSKQSADDIITVSASFKYDYYLLLPA